MRLLSLGYKTGCNYCIQFFFLKCSSNACFILVLIALQIYQLKVIISLVTTLKNIPSTSPKERWLGGKQRIFLCQRWKPIESERVFCVERRKKGKLPRNISIAALLNSVESERYTDEQCNVPKNELLKTVRTFPDSIIIWR